MRFDRSNSKKIFFCSLLLFLISLTYRILNPFTQPTVKELTYTGKPADNSKINSSNKIKNLSDTEIRLDRELFFNKLNTSYAADKDIFYNHLKILEDIPKELPDKIEKPDSELSKERSEALESAKIRQESERASALSGIVEELLHIKVIGASKTAAGRLSFFIKDADNVMLIGRGDKLKGQYPVTELTQDYILIKIPQFNENVRINLKDFNENRYL